jgi:hypothetical protein
LLESHAVIVACEGGVGAAAGFMSFEKLPSAADVVLNVLVRAPCVKVIVIGLPAPKLRP